MSNQDNLRQLLTRNGMDPQAQRYTIAWQRAHNDVWHPTLIVETDLYAIAAHRSRLHHMGYRTFVIALDRRGA